MDPDHDAKFPLHEAAREGKTQTAESLVNANPKLANTKDDDERLPIHWAVAYNHLPIVELLVSTKNFDPDVEDGSGWTPLMIASSLKNAEGDPIIELLLRKGADVTAKSNSGQVHTTPSTPSTPHARKRSKEKQTADHRMNGIPTQNALHFATSKANISTVRTLIANKCSARVKDKRGQLPLHRAAAIGSTAIINILLKDGKSPANATDMDGMTALHHAICEGHGDAAITLLKAGAETDKRDADGRLAIDMAPDGKVKGYIIQTAEREGIEL
ncbi:ankyrin repeat domain-containing protein [Aspergillus affinis]|uniref:ankyrin repeat domain-containing protein n=1 Tax=Aspergillus affinis TaxID=1070780 RepID=UPI0022FE0A93|nr:ankyrin [Aspergillus affinis]KAI9038758.1 ankyrin [Aspergillus affinis]